MVGCRQTQVLAMTTPGSRVVLVCGVRFAAMRRRDPLLTEVVLIHETLHLLGLGENPPTTREITGRVFALRAVTGAPFYGRARQARRTRREAHSPSTRASTVPAV